MLRYAIVLGMLLGLGACANEYADAPEATGEWVAANPPDAAPSPPPPPVVYRNRKWTRR